MSIYSESTERARLRFLENEEFRTTQATIGQIHNAVKDLPRDIVIKDF